MAKKGYWVSAYRSIKDPDKVAAYAKLAGPALESGAHGAKYLTRDVASNAYEAGIKARIVMVEFESVAKAIAARQRTATRRRSRCSARRGRARFPHRRGAGIAAPPGNETNRKTASEACRLRIY